MSLSVKWESVWGRLTRLRPQEIFLIEASGLRTTAATALPLIVGQILGRPGDGLLIGMGALQLCFIDFADARPPALFWGASGSALAALLGGLISHASPATAVALMFAVTFVLAMLAVWGEVAGNTGFVLTITYASAQVMPVSPHTAAQYGALFALGGFWATGLTLLLWKLRRRLPDAAGAEPSSAELEKCTSGVRALRDNLTIRSSIFQHAIRTAIATAIAVAICRFFHPPHGFWLILTCLIILKPDYAATRRRTAERLLGTIVGGLLAMLPAACIHNAAVLDCLLIFFGIVAFSHLPRNYGLYVVFLTPFVVLLASVAAPNDAQAALARMGETLLGGALAFSIAFLLRSPRHYLPALRSPA